MKKKSNPALRVKRKAVMIELNNSRVITRPHIPANENRIKNIISRTLSLDDDSVKTLLDKVLDEFSDRHRHFKTILKKNFELVKPHIKNDIFFSEEKILLLGSYFTMEYSIEAAALFNPSIVTHPIQLDIQNGEIRFIMSFRATGEGHISSIEFRAGTIDSENEIHFDPVSKYVDTPDIHPDPKYDARLFRQKLKEMGTCSEAANYLIDKLGNTFTFEQLKKKIADLNSDDDYIRRYTARTRQEAMDLAMWVARSNYEMQFIPSHSISERVIFPVSDSESRGIEDARFVRFVDDDNTITYYATYTAYNGIAILPQLMETKDFIKFNVITLNGKAVQNKGMALFPRKVNGKYAMLSRQDGENNYIMFSENLHFWHEAQILQRPTYPWEFVQIGNCGSPIETSAGWLVLVHGVGPMRQYGISIELLDLEDPSKIIGRIKEPILTPDRSEREGYVPNVVYSCGAMIHNNELIIPYAIADQKTTIATISVPEILSLMSKSL